MRVEKVAITFTRHAKALKDKIEIFFNICLKINFSKFQQLI